MTKKISIIVAVASNLAIGKDNDLLWHISDDLKRFKVLTSGKTVVMGERTFYSLPFRPLKNRVNIIITDKPDLYIEGCVMANSIEEAISKMDDSNENFVMGGGSIYKQFIDIADKLYLTRVHKSFDADTFFPEIDESKWKLIEKIDMEAEVGSDFSFSYEVYVKA